MVQHINLIKRTDGEKQAYMEGYKAGYNTGRKLPIIIKGRWERQYEGSGLLRCSNCGYEYCDYIECVNYCGNCGAKMEV